LGFELGRNGTEHRVKSSAEVISCPSPETIFHGFAAQQSFYCGHITVPALTLKLSNAMATFAGAVVDGVAKSIVKPVGLVVVGAEPIMPCE